MRALVQIGLQRFLDITALILVVGGAVEYAMLKSDKKSFVTQFRNGAVYFS